MTKLIGFLLSIFSLSGPVASFFLWIGKKIALKPLVLPIQYSIVGALFVFKISFLISVMTLLLTFYLRFNDLLDYFQSLFSFDVFEIPLSILRSIGLIDAFIDVFTLYSVSFVSLILLFVSKYFIQSLKLASDEFYKIGMLLQG